jgi:hypothetical protein
MRRVISAVVVAVAVGLAAAPASADVFPPPPSPPGPPDVSGSPNGAGVNHSLCSHSVLVITKSQEFHGDCE